MQIVTPVLPFLADEHSFTFKGGLFLVPIATTHATGTNARFAPQIDYFEKVFLPVASRMGVSYSNFNRKLRCVPFKRNLAYNHYRGFYPRGGGVVVAESMKSEKLSPITMTERGMIKEIEIISFVSGKIPESA